MNSSKISIFIFLPIFIFSCKNTSEKNTHQYVQTASQSAIINKYFVEHTAQYISIQDGFTFRFNDDFADERTEVNGVKLSPRIEGTWKWLSDNTLSFSPSERLLYNQYLKVTMHLDELLQSDEHPSDPIDFVIQTRALRMNMNIEGLKISQVGSDDELSIEGNIISSDYVDTEELESLLDVTQHNNTPTINWTHDKRGQRHSFSIINIKQDVVKNSELTLKWKNNGWDKNFSGKEVIPIAAKSKFTLSDVKVSTSSDRMITAFFSRPLQPSQNLKGLVRINDSSKGIKTDIDGNHLNIYPPAGVKGRFDFSISDKILSTDNQKLNSAYSNELQFDLVNPTIRRVGSGMIMPKTAKTIMPIEVVNVKALDIEVFKIFDNNILQFLQNNNINGEYGLNQVGHIIHREKMTIQNMDNENNHNQWTRVGIDLKNIINDDPKAIYQIRIGYQSAYTIKDCEAAENEKAFTRSGEESLINYSNNYYNEWESRGDPCSSSYYNPERFIKANIILSDIGVIVKEAGQNQYHIAANSISSCNSLYNANVSMYDFQQQLIVEGNTDGSGFLKVKTDKDVAFIIVNHEAQYAYLKVKDQNSNSMSNFDVSGTDQKSGIDGFIYTDRGVYRPGDTIFLNFMLDDTQKPLPLAHPVSLEFKNPKGNKKYAKTTSEQLERIYSFTIPTEQNDLTGQYRAKVTVGAHHFTKTIRIETIKPNRLKINIESPDELLYSIANKKSINIKSKWLHGASAGGMKAKSEATFQNITPQFKNYKDYKFMDPARAGSQDLAALFDKNLDANGNGKINLRLNPKSFPGKVVANLKTRVFESSGNFSEDYSSIKISPFDTYVGVKVPEGKWGNKSIKIGEKNIFRIVTTDYKGIKKGNRKLSIGLYDIKWQWWYYKGERYNIYRLNSGEHKDAFFTQNVTTNADGEFELPLDLQDITYGRKMIRVCDLESGHCTGEFFYTRGRGSSQNEQERESLSELNFTSDKSKYEIGENVKVTIPTEKGSKILISLETGNDVILKEWIEGQEVSTEYEFSTTQSMTPNVYIHAIMVQSYDEKQNDLPLRMYGVVPIKVEDSKTILHPKIMMSDKLEPNQKFSINVSEENDQPMAYTIAIVDEGLLDLTNFGTPNPYSHFFAKQSLGVKTWDLYEYIMTGINGTVDRMITVGGDDDTGQTKGAKKAIRFKPVVMTAGPFYIHSGESQNHSFTMPNYIGSVRAMVIAKKDRAYGKAQETIPVKKELMILPTLPRVVGPSEKVTIPVSVFANANHIKNVSVTIKSSPHLQWTSSSTQEVKFSEPGEKLVYFTALVTDQLGIAKVKVSAKSGKAKIDQDVELDVRNPNPYESVVYDRVIQPNETWNPVLKTIGMKGTNEGLVELSSFPTMNLESRLDYLVSYPYGCLEQTISSAFPQLSLDAILDLTPNRKRKIDIHINGAIRKLTKLQKNNGGMAYWPGSRWANKWGTTYAGHFLIKAKEKGYFIPSSLLNSWEGFQKSTARSFRIDRSRKRWYQQWQMKDQAYRLYSLALHGHPELPSMNVLSKEIDLPQVAQFLLAAAYALSGQDTMAEKLIQNTNTEIDPYTELAYSYGSDLRDMAFVAQTLQLLEKDQEAGKVIRKIAKKLNSNRWYSTQTLAHALSAVGDFLGETEREDMNFTFDIGESGSQIVEYKRPIYLYSFNPDKSDITTKSSIKNNSKDVLFARVTLKGQRPPLKALSAKSFNKNITLAVKYTDLKGATIDPSILERGTDFIAHVSVKNQNSKGDILDEMALSHIIPSGWEIQSGGLSNSDSALKEDNFEYRDTRDDRVYTFFDLGNKKEYKILLSATYEGEYFLPPILCEAMYDNEIQAKTKGMKVRVSAPKQAK